MVIQNNTLTVLKGVQKGFTLVEMVVVILIIGVLLGIAIPAYQYYNKAAWNASVAAEANVIVTGYLSTCANNVNNTTDVDSAAEVVALMISPATTPLGGPWAISGTNTVVASLAGLTLTFTPPANGCNDALTAATLVLTPAAASNPIFTNSVPIMTINIGGGVTYIPGT